MPAIEDRVVAITGASAGIGRALATLLVTRGARVAAFARRTDRLTDLAGELSGHRGTLLPVAGDVTNEQDVEALVARTVETFGRIDVMVANAGIGFHGPLDDTPTDVVRRLFDVNVMGTIHAARSALTFMRRQGHGHIIAVSSIVGRRGVEGSSVYAATKAAQVTFIESLRAEFAGTNLHASVVYPIATATEFHEAIRRDYGNLSAGRGPRQPAEAVANAIAQCIERPRAEVYPYGRSKLLALLAVALPATTDRIVSRYRRRSRPDGST
jgi:short-subunit dehydrogenase